MRVHQNKVSNSYQGAPKQIKNSCKGASKQNTKYALVMCTKKVLNIYQGAPKQNIKELLGWYTRTKCLSRVYLNESAPKQNS